MATVESGSLRTVVVRGDAQEIPLTFPVPLDGVCCISEVRLSTRFQFLEGSIYLDEEVYDVDTGVLTHTVGHEATTIDSRKSWLLKCGTYRVYGVTSAVQRASTQILRSNVSIASNHQRTLPCKVKLEPGPQTIQILSDDSDLDLQVPSKVSQPACSPSFVDLRSPEFQSSEDILPCTSKPPVPPSSSTTISIVDCIKKLGARKGSKSILSRVDFSTVQILTVNCLPPSFDGTVIFVLPSLRTSSS
jgi:hypothetical protein